MRGTPELAKPECIIAVRNLEKYFPLREGIFQRVTGHVKSVDGVSFEIRRGETVGLVGESGCGKSTLGRCVSGLSQPTLGGVFYGLDADALETLDRTQHFGLKAKGADTHRFNNKHRVGSMSAGYRHAFRRSCQVVFQDTQASLNPRRTVGSIVGRPIRLHERLHSSAVTDRVVELLESVGLGAQHLYRYPHQFSGGQRQRISIARAIACRPELVVLDEPTSSLDVSVQAQILNLLSNLQKKLGLTYLFISHDLNVVQHMSDRLLVMYLGKIVELGQSEDLFAEPKHPYTEALIAANPVTSARVRSKVRLRGGIPSPADPPQGCRFHTRCPRAFGPCGWEFKDVVVALGQQVSLADGLVESVHETPFKGTLSFRSADLAEEAAQWIRTAAPEGMRAADQKMSVIGGDLQVEFGSVSPVRLTSVGEDRASSCLLFTEEDSTT